MKNGFTLIELLAVIVILAILATITVPTITNTINNSKEKSLVQQKNNIVNAAERWGTDNTNELPKAGKTVKKSISDLQSSGYLESSDIIDPTTNKKMNGCVKITLKSSTKQYKYEYTDSCS